MPADYSRVHRLLRIITLIQSGRGWTAAKLADACDVGVRTIYRDMKLFRPYELLFDQRAWYTYGHHDEVRCLKLSRFTAIEPTANDGITNHSLGFPVRALYEKRKLRQHAHLFERLVIFPIVGP